MGRAGLYRQRLWLSGGRGGYSIHAHPIRVISLAKLPPSHYSHGSELWK